MFSAGSPALSTSASAASTIFGRVNGARWLRFSVSERTTHSLQVTDRGEVYLVISRANVPTIGTVKRARTEARDAPTGAPQAFVMSP